MPAMACVDPTAPIGLPRPHPSLTEPEAPHPDPTATWSTDLSSSLYNIDGWGAPYFAVNASGNIAARPAGSATLPHQELDLLKVVQRASGPKSTGGLALRLPMIVRFPDILNHRLESLNSAFELAIRSSGYRAHYQGVYPVKCNQDRHIVEDVVEFGYSFRFGLEAGSKPELILAMACLTKGNPESFIVCNGYKDEEYIALALMGRRLNLNTFIVLELEEELDTVIDTSRKLGVRPVIGIRAKLRTKHAGHFGSTSGENGKFGLTTTQILSVARKLHCHEMLDCLQLLHFHIGSQIPSTALLSDGVTEAAQIYCELVKLGASMRVIDIGGGLGIDYDGSHSGGSDMSIAYNLDEYASSVVQSIQSACNRKNIPHPIICSESGRALISHHSVLVFEAISSTTSEPQPASTNPNLAYILEKLADEAYINSQNLISSAVRREHDSCLVYADRLKWSSLDQFKDGSLSLEHLASVDQLCNLVAKEMGRAARPPHTYHVNLSIFTSMPDFWAIGQLFPIVPIHRLDEKPSVSAVLSDLTCDSDGKVDSFIGDTASIPLHEIGSGSGGGAYYLGMFLGGAYQEALGGMHNLFGGPSVVRVLGSKGGGFEVARAAAGATCAEVLRGMRHEPEMMVEALKRRGEDCCNGKGEGGRVARGVARALRSMPYLAREVGDGEVDDRSDAE